MTVQAAYSLLHTVRPVFTAFFAATTAIEFQLNFLKRQFAQERIRRAIPESAGPDAFDPTMAYGVDIGEEKPDYVHDVPFSVFRNLNAKNGPTTVQLGNGIAVQIFALWEYRFRDEIASEIGIEATQLKVPLFGDLRLLRHAILHSSGVFEDNPKRLELATWVKKGMKVEFDEGKIIWLSEQIRAFAHEAERLRPAV